MEKPVGLRFDWMVSKIQDWKISFRNRVNHFHKSVPFTEKRSRKPGFGIKISRIPHYISLKFRIPRVAFQTLYTANNKGAF